jgi:thioredoxin 1
MMYGRFDEMDVKELEKYGIDAPDKGKLIIDLSSDWCMPCKVLSPILEHFRDEGLIKLIQINVDNNRELAQELNIHAVPTLLFFKDGKLLDKTIGIDGEPLVIKGVMMGAVGDIILNEIIRQM